VFRKLVHVPLQFVVRVVGTTTGVVAVGICADRVIAEASGILGDAPIGNGVDRPIRFAGGSTGVHTGQSELFKNRGVHT